MILSDLHQISQIQKSVNAVPGNDNPVEDASLDSAGERAASPQARQNKMGLSASRKPVGQVTKSASVNKTNAIKRPFG